MINGSESEMRSDRTKPWRVLSHDGLVSQSDMRITSGSRLVFCQLWPSESPIASWLAGLQEALTDDVTWLTCGAGAVGDSGDEPLLFAGRLAPVALVLVGVPVRAAHRDKVFVALEHEHRVTQESKESDSLRKVRMMWITDFAVGRHTSARTKRTQNIVQWYKSHSK